MGNEQGRAVSCNSKTHAREYFFLRHGHHMWDDPSGTDVEEEELTPLKARQPASPVAGVNASAYIIEPRLVVMAWCLPRTCPCF